MKILLKVSAVVGAMLGLMAVINGTRVILGLFDPGYNILYWLVYYNVLFGLISVYAGFAIFKQHIIALKISSLIALGHMIVLLVLLTIFNDVVAKNSIQVMSLRSIIWVLIVVIISQKKNARV